MVGCCAVNCRNRSGQGVKFFHIPNGKNDQERRKIWLAKIKRKDFDFVKSACLCELHFEESQFEQNRQDNWKKLKPTAIPTLFNLPNPPNKLTSKQIKGVGCPKKGTVLKSHSSKRKNAHLEPDQFEKKTPEKLKPNASRTIFSHFPQPKHSKSPKKRQQDISHSDINNQPAKLACLEHSYSTHSSVHVTEESGEDLLTPMIEERCPQEPVCALSESELVSTLKANLEDVKRKLREVERQKESLEKKYSTLFNSDQIAFMESAAMQAKIIWSDDTVRKALQLWFSCGFSGYSMLLSQGFPLPSDTTLQRRLGNIPLNDDIIPEVMDMPKRRDSSPANNPNMSLCMRNENSVQETVHSQTSTTSTTTRSVIKKLKPTCTMLPFTSPQAKARADEFEAVGMNVTAKLRKMSFTQQSIVKSLIIKMLARGLLEELTEDTDLITITNYYDYNNSPENSNSASSEDLSNCEV